MIFTFFRRLETLRRQANDLYDVETIKGTSSTAINVALDQLRQDLDREVTVAVHGDVDQVAYALTSIEGIARRLEEEARMLQEKADGWRAMAAKVKGQVSERLRVEGLTGLQGESFRITKVTSGKAFDIVVR